MFKSTLSRRSMPTRKPSISTFSLGAALGATMPLMESVDAKAATEPATVSRVSVKSTTDSETSLECYDGDVCSSPEPTFDKTQWPEWSSNARKRFEDLAIKEALETISNSEAEELELLSISRRQTENPTPTEEIQARIKHDSMIRKMETVLNEYVRYLGASDQTGTSSK